MFSLMQPQMQTPGEHELAPPACVLALRGKGAEEVRHVGASSAPGGQALVSDAILQGTPPGLPEERPMPGQDSC